MRKLYYSEVRDCCEKIGLNFDAKTKIIMPKNRDIKLLTLASMILVELCDLRGKEDQPIEKLMPVFRILEAIVSAVRQKGNVDIDECEIWDHRMVNDMKEKED